MTTRFYPFTLVLHAPLLLPTLAGDPNNVHSAEYIPGSAIRGAVASRLAPNADMRIFRQYILSGQVCYLNAYPEVRGQRALPVPVSFRQEKYGSTTHDLAFYSGMPKLDLEDVDVWPDAQLKGLEASFLSLTQADLVPARIALERRVHQQRDRSMGRAYTYRDPQQPHVEESRGTIFTYEALEAKQRFQGIVAISGHTCHETDALWQKIKKLLGQRVSLGRSRSARYGGSVSIHHSDDPRKFESAGASRTVRQPALQAEDLFCVFLTSDYIGRNPESGQCDPTVFKQNITENLGSDRVEILRTRWAFRLVGGFNRKWGLQLPQTLALQAGSLLVLKAKTEIPCSALRAIEQQGLGERRTEGFGRVVFLEAPQKTCSISKSEQPEQPEMPEGTVPPLIITMQKRIIVEALEQRITERAASLARGANQIPGPSLLGRLRVPFRGGADAGLVTLRRWLDTEKPHCLRRSAMNQLDACRIDKKSLTQWIRDRVCTDDVASDLKQILGMQQVIGKNCIQSQADAQRMLMEDVDWLDWLRARLIDEVLALLARKKHLTSGGG